MSKYIFKVMYFIKYISYIYLNVYTFYYIHLYIYKIWVFLLVYMQPLFSYYVTYNDNFVRNKNDFRTLCIFLGSEFLRCLQILTIIVASSSAWIRAISLLGYA